MFNAAAYTMTVIHDSNHEDVIKRKVLNACLRSKRLVRPKMEGVIHTLRVYDIDVYHWA
jgi:hypothetical protein